MFDIKSFYEAKDVKDAVEALVREPEAEVISGGTDVLIRVREGKDAGRALVSIHNIKELKGVKVLEKSVRSEEHTSELQSHHMISYAVFCLKKIFF